MVKNKQKLTRNLLVATSVLLFAAIGTLALLSTRAATPLRILPVGDSITDGFRAGGGCYLSGNDSTTAYQGGYRIPLGQKYASGAVLFVGPHTNGPTNMNGGRAHAGSCGAWIGGAVEEPGNTTNSVWQRMDWQKYASYNPDIVLVHIGTNDIVRGQAQAGAGDRLAALIDKFTAQMPNARIIVAAINTTGGTTPTVFNDKVRAAVSDRKAAGKKVYLADMTTTGMTCAADFRPGDCVHPSDIGYAKMANVWYAAIQQALGSSATPNPNPTPAPTPVPTPVSTPTPTPAPSGQGSVNDGSFTYTGSWQTSNNTATYQGDDHYSRTTGSTYSLIFSGTQARVYATRAAHHGIVAIKVDNGTETTVDLYATSRQDQQLVYTSPALSGGTHTITARVTGTKNSASSDTVVTADRIDVTAGGSTTPQPTPTPQPSTCTLAGDANCDNRVNALDLSILVSKDGQNYPPADFNKDGTVGAADLAILIGKWTW